MKKLFLPLFLCLALLGSAQAQTETPKPAEPQLEKAHPAALVKVFVWTYQDPESARKFAAKIQEWLNKNPSIEILHVTQTMAYDSRNLQLVTMLYYRER